jgi:hypothetical protein
MGGEWRVKEGAKKWVKGVREGGKNSNNEEGGMKSR